MPTYLCWLVALGLSAPAIKRKISQDIWYILTCIFSSTQWEGKAASGSCGEKEKITSEDTGTASFAWPNKADIAQYSEDIPPKPQHSWIWTPLCHPLPEQSQHLSLRTESLDLVPHQIFTFRVEIIKLCYSNSVLKNNICFLTENILIQQDLRKPLPSHSMLESQLDVGYWDPGKYILKLTLKKKTNKNKLCLDNKDNFPWQDITCSASRAQGAVVSSWKKIVLFWT